MAPFTTCQYGRVDAPITPNPKAHMTTLRRTKLYPTPENCQLTDDIGPAVQKLEHALALLKALPLEEQASAEITGWFGVRIDYSRQISGEQVRDEQLAMLSQLIEQAAAAGKGISDADVQRIILHMRALRSGDAAPI